MFFFLKPPGIRYKGLATLIFEQKNVYDNLQFVLITLCLLLPTLQTVFVPICPCLNIVQHLWKLVKFVCVISFFSSLIRNSSAGEEETPLPHTFPISWILKGSCEILFVYYLPSYHEIFSSNFQNSELKKTHLWRSKKNSRKKARNLVLCQIVCLCLRKYFFNNKKLPKGEVYKLVRVRIQK